MRRVGHIKTTYLELTETWFYSFLRSFLRFDAFVFCEEIKNRDQFPYEHVLQLTRPRPSERMLGMVSRTFGFRHLGVEKNYEALLREKKVDLLHAHFGPWGLYMLPVAKKLGLPLVTSFYGFDTTLKNLSHVKPARLPIFPQHYWRSAYNKLFAEGDFFVGFGEKMCEDLIALGCPPEKIRDVHAGVVLEERSFTSRSLPHSGEIRLLMVNRLVEKKGVIFALEALSLLKDKYPRLRMRIIGDGPLRGELEAAGRRLNIESSIDWLGTKDHGTVLREMSECHIFLSSSVKAQSGDSEGGINQTVIDALSLGLVTVATAESSSQLVIHQKTGMLAQAGDSEDLAHQIEYLMQNPQVWSEYAQRGRELIERDFDQRKQTGKLEGIYEELLRKRG